MAVQLWRIDAQHPDADGAFTRFVETERDANTAVLLLRTFGWLVDAVRVNLATENSRECELLLGNIFPVIPDDALVALVRDRTHSIAVVAINTNARFEPSEVSDV